MQHFIRFTISKIILLGHLLFLADVSFAQGLDSSVKRILFLGNSITWAGNYVNDVTTYLTVQHPGRQLVIINAGLSSETVSGLSEEGHAGGSFPRPDLHERLERVLQQTKPDLVFACYGMNDGIYLPFDSNRFQKFKDGIDWLHKTVVKTGARLIHLTPPDYDEARGKRNGYANVLDTYSNWLLKQKKAKGWEVIDIHYPMKKYLKAHRKVDAAFGLNGFALAEDGIHPGETGHWIIARQMLVYLGYREVSKLSGIRESISQIPAALQLLALVTQRNNMMRDAWLTATKHARPGLPEGLPLQEAQAKSDSLSTQIKLLLPGN
jgi:lysophospholipase L1-like esterase